ncbi:pleckstrin homology domain-containing family B member 2 isoform X2 [Hydra vulgaris]|uniref:Pleckstrin homology domain-containing family B member 2 isoform X2 n=1 Tax=Hydra vulgaris TaxID=6087 RepID=A0ABM4CHI3_HYDVU
MSTVKSGWLSRREGSFIFKDWYKKHCVLYSDGEFSVYTKASDATAELRINMKIECSRIEVGFDVGSINLPKNISSVESVFAIITKSNKRHIFCASNDSDCRDWFGALENARTAPPLSKQVPFAPPMDLAPPPYAPLEYSQPLQSNGWGNSGSGSQLGQQRPQTLPSQYYQQPGYIPQPRPNYGVPSYGPQPMYGTQPMYGQPMYGQPVYVSQAPQAQPQQQQQGSNNNTRNMLLAGGGGLIGGYLLGNAISEMSHHHMNNYSDNRQYNDNNYDSGGGFDGGGGGFDGGGGGFDGGGGGFDF